MATAVSSPNTTMRIALIGNPNCGKTTLFNALTGLRQKVGNYPGVTVEKKTGVMFSLHGDSIQLIDLPGTYSLAPRSLDETVSRDVLLGVQEGSLAPDAVICVVDASNLERNLYLVSQIIDIGIPLIVALNMMDVAEEAGLHLDPTKLSALLGVPVIPCQANTRKGIVELRQAINQINGDDKLATDWAIPADVAPAWEELRERLAASKIAHPRAYASLLLSDRRLREDSESVIPLGIRQFAGTLHQTLLSQGINTADSLVQARYEKINEICEQVIRKDSDPYTLSFTDRADAILVHPVWGWLCFGGLMTLMFLSIFTLATYPMDWIDQGFSALADRVRGVMPTGDLQSLITNGVIAGVGGVVIFLPQILILFLFIGLLESSGYMARAAFIMDRVMSRVGLNGKSFIPLLSSYACAIPGIMATRTIEHPKDRLITILVAPFMSCSARIPVYVLLIAAMFPREQVDVVTKSFMMLGLYALGTAGAFLFAWIFKKAFGKRDPSMFLMELPPYRRPVLSAVLRQLWERSMIFLKRAGTIIFGLSIILWALATYPKSDSEDPGAQLESSFMGRSGKVIEPIVEPLGFDWKIGVGIGASIAAREVFVGTMAVIYSVEDEENDQLLHEALANAKRSDGSPVYTPLTCLSLLVFYVFALQCLATVAIVRRETNSWRWPLFQLGYMTGFAYFMSLLVYQGGRLMGFS